MACFALSTNSPTLRLCRVSWRISRMSPSDCSIQLPWRRIFFAQSEICSQKAVECARTEAERARACPPRFLGWSPHPCRVTFQRGGIEAMTNREEVLASVAHELRGPLTAIVGSIHLLEREKLGGPARRALEIIRRNAMT